MDYYKESKLKLLNQLAKRVKFKAFYIWRYSQIHSPERISGLAKTEDPGFLSPTKRHVHSMNKHRPSNSHTELHKIIAKQHSPLHLRSSNPTSPEGCSLFDQIKSTLQIKAGVNDTLKNSEPKSESFQSKIRKIIVEEPEEKGFFNRHKRNNTATLENLAIVSSKSAKQALFHIKINESK